MNLDKFLNYGIWFALFGILVGLVALPRGGAILIVLLVIVALTILLMIKGILMLADVYDSLPPKGQAKVKRYGKRTALAIIDKVKKNEKYRDVAEFFEKILRD